MNESPHNMKFKPQFCLQLHCSDVPLQAPFANGCSGQLFPDTLLRAFSYSIGVLLPSVECSRTAL